MGGYNMTTYILNDEALKKVIGSAWMLDHEKVSLDSFVILCGGQILEEYMSDLNRELINARDLIELQAEKIRQQHATIQSVDRKNKQLTQQIEQLNDEISSLELDRKLGH